jgi:hypothetical protein
MRFRIYTFVRENFFYGVHGVSQIWKEIVTPSIRKFRTLQLHVIQALPLSRIHGHFLRGTKIEERYLSVYASTSCDQYDHSS